MGSAAFGVIAGTAGAGEQPLGVVEFNRQPEIFEDGGRWLRVLVEWQYLEPADDAFNWSSGFDNWINEAESLGMDVSPIIAIGKCWATGFEGDEATWPSHPPLDLTETFDPVFGYSETFYDFVYQFLATYGYRLTRLSIENEVNTFEFWQGTMDEYRRLVATARKAVDDVAPHVMLFDSGLGSGSWGAAVGQWMLEHEGYSDAETLEFVNDYYENNVYAQFQWSDIQEFRYWVRQPFVQENNKRVEYIMSIAGDYCDGLNFKFTEYAHLLRPLVEWMDDVLAAEGTPLPVKANNEASNWPLGSQTLEAQNMFRMVITSLSLGVDQTLWFPYSNEDIGTPRRGLLDEDGNDTIQRATFEMLTRHIGRVFTYHSRAIMGGDIQRYRFTRPDRPDPMMDALWWDDGSHGAGSRSLTLPVPSGTVKVHHVRYDDTSEFLDPVGGEVTLTVDEGGHILKYMLTTTDVDPAPEAFAPSLASFPNPFRPLTTISFTLPEGDRRSVAVEIFDVAGRRVAELMRGTLPAGDHTVGWDGRDDAGADVSAGTYWMRLTTPDGVSSERITRLR